VGSPRDHEEVLRHLLAGGAGEKKRRKVTITADACVCVSVCALMRRPSGMQVEWPFTSKAAIERTEESRREIVKLDVNNYQQHYKA
jgi:hypothetical protein